MRAVERTAAVLSGATSNYDTDVMRRLVEKGAELSGKRYAGGDSPDETSMRVIADHARTAAFLIAEGVMPDKQKREYVLRRVMRRAIRHGHRLGIGELFLHRVALEVVDAMGDDYPELVERRELIERVIQGEEERFRATLRRGMKILDDRFVALSNSGDEELSAEVAADLYTTYGFPLDLTEVIAAEHDVRVDLSGAAKIVNSGDHADGPIDPTAQLDPAYRQIAGGLAATRFTGYETEVGESEVVGIVAVNNGVRAVVDTASEGDEVEIVVAATPFYAESGGQVGDVGVMRRDASEMAVDHTHRPVGDVTLHHGKVTAGSLAVGDVVELEVDHVSRAATRRNHSATHLLHWALKQVLGQHAQQKGSLVGPDVLRFDFAHNRPLTQEQITAVEDLVNAKILSNAPVQTDVLAIDEARARGAVAIFEEKYGDTVRVLTMTDDSVELCGGTHCSQLGDIGLFKITSEGGTAAGVRRVLAATGSHALGWVRGLQADLLRARAAAKAQTGGDLADKIGKIVQSERKLEKRVRELEKQLLEGGNKGGGIDAMLAQAKKIGGVDVLGIRVADGTTMGGLRELSEKLRDKLGGKSVVLAAAQNGDKAQLALMISKAATAELKAGSLIKPIAKLVGGSGGGRPDMAQAGGTKPENLDEAVAALYGEVEAALG